MKINVEMTAEEFNDYQDYVKNGKKYYQDYLKFKKESISLEDFLLLKGFKKDEEYTRKSLISDRRLIYVKKYKCEDSVVTIETEKFVG